MESNDSPEILDRRGDIRHPWLPFGDFIDRVVHKVLLPFHSWKCSQGVVTAS